MTNNIRNSGVQPLENLTQSDLPDELWEKILSKLTLKDNIRSSAVSKRFLAIATLVRKTDKPPLLMLFPYSVDPDSYKFVDPFNHKSYWLDLPELRGAQFHHSKDGWLLMGNYESESLFLFRPHIRELIQLPKISLYSRIFSFSSAPTAPDCTVFVVNRVFAGTIEISTCRPGDKKWTKVNYQTTLRHTFWKSLILCKGLLYIIGTDGLAVIYNPKESHGTVQDIQIPRIPIFSCSLNSWMIEFLGEYNGNIIKVFIFSDRNPVIFKLDLDNRMWVEMKTLGGNNLFISYFSSHARTDFLGNKRNNVYFSEVDLGENDFISYSFEEGRLVPNNHNCEWPIDDRRGIWIDAPEDFSN